MRKFILAFVLLFAFTIVKAQQTFLFRIKYLPSSLYESSTSSNTNMQMDFSGDSTAMAAIKAKGMKLPLMINSTSNIEFNVKTGAAKTDGFFPMAIYFKDQTVADVTSSADTKMSPLTK